MCVEEFKAWYRSLNKGERLAVKTYIEESGHQRKKVSSGSDGVNGSEYQAQRINSQVSITPVKGTASNADVRRTQREDFSR